MAEIKPFRGWRYNPERVRLADVVAPPYDVVTPEEQAFYLQKSPYNVFHLELGPRYATDHARENQYTRAKKFWDTWRQEGVLIKENAPSLYLYRLRFFWKGQRLTRRGLIALVRLEPWEKKIILPHEKTFDQVTADRLNLLRTTRAQFSQIFCLYHDPGLETLNVLEETGEKLYQVEDREGFEHELLRITSPPAISQIENALRENPLYIADGHHRYTTALRFMKEMEERYGKTPPRCFHYMMMYLCPFEEPGLLVLPTHRLLQLPFKAEELLARLSPFGEVVEMPAPETENLDQMTKGLEPHEFLLLHENKVFRFTLKDPLRIRWQEEDPEIFKLPVALFTRVLEEALGISEAALKKEGKAVYTPWVNQIKEKAHGPYFGFLLPPTPVLSLEEIARAGRIMPHKSTYFHPKILTGMVFFEILPDKGPPC